MRLRTGRSRLFLTPGEAAAFFRQPADLPIRLDRIGDPRLGPARIDAGLHRALVDLAAFGVEHRQLAARFVEAALQPGALRRGRAVIVFRLFNLLFGQVATPLADSPRSHHGSVLAASGEAPRLVTAGEKKRGALG